MNPPWTQILQRGSNWLTGGRREPHGDNVAVVIVDFDNLANYVHGNRYTANGQVGGPPRDVYLDDIIDWMTASYDAMGIDAIAETYVFRTIVKGRFIQDFNLKVRDQRRFSFNDYRVPKGIRGYGDDEMYRLATAIIEQGRRCDTLVFMSQDNGVAVAGQKIMAGFKPHLTLEPDALERRAKFYELAQPTADTSSLIQGADDRFRLSVPPRDTPEVMVVSPLVSQTGYKPRYFSDNNNVVDFDEIIRQLGYLPSTPFPHASA